MNSVVCPHCKKHHFSLASAPRDVIVVVPCPHCSELTVFFRERVIALSRQILENGTFDERKEHLAHVIAEFLELGILPKALGKSFFHAFGAEQGEFEYVEEFASEDFAEDIYEEAFDAPKPITQQELDRFVRMELKSIDSGAYFRKHFE